MRWDALTLRRPSPRRSSPRWPSPGWSSPRQPAPETPEAATFEQAILPHLDAAYNLARWLVRDATLAEDVVQDAVLRALDHFAGFRGGDARPWMMRIVRNVAYSALASGQRRAETSLETEDAGGAAPALTVPDSADDPETALARREGLQALEAALSALPAELRECLVLRELEGLSYKEIAHVTGVPVGTVMSRLWRARQTLTGGQATGDEA